MSRRLGARLAAWTTLATALAVLVFAATATFVVWARESRERDNPDQDERVDESPADEALDQLVISLAVTAPVVIVLAAITTRRLARRVTDRIDNVVAAATRMTDEHLGERLPV